jgi:hypothetical protein
MARLVTHILLSFLYADFIELMMCLDFDDSKQCDDVMTAVMEKLAIPIPSFTLKRRVKVSTAIETPASGGRSLRLTVAGVDLDGTPASLFPSVRVSYDASLKPRNKEEV